MIPEVHLADGAGATDDLADQRGSVEIGKTGSLRVQVVTGAGAQCVINARSGAPAGSAAASASPVKHVLCTVGPVAKTGLERAVGT